MNEARRTVVKVCGITRLADALAALEAGADRLGFVLWPESPRHVDPARAGAIVAALPPGVAVAVLVAPEPDEALRLARTVGAAHLQLHRVDAARWPAGFPLPVTFAVPVGGDGALAGPLPDAPHRILLDTADARPGGTGRTLPWTTARDLAATREVMLAGGLDGDNVGEALATVAPWGVDAASRLESAPGVKDPDRVRQFVAAVRRHDALHAAGA